MELNREPFKKWFGFTRRERRSSFMLLIIIISVFGLRLAVPESSIQIEDVTDSLLMYAISRETVFIAEDKSKPGIKTNTLSEEETGSASVYHQKRPLINLNTCDTSQLISLPGIGKVLSARIIKYRNLLGGYASVEQLTEVYGLSPETYEIIKGRVFADTSQLIQININTATYRDLLRFPYFEKDEVTGIFKYLELKGRVESINDLTDNNLITPEKAARVKHYLKFE
jgi:DNA uptake protein ComE-like DNA-binding protein